MDCYTLVVLACLSITASAWSAPFYPVHRGPIRVTRFAPLPIRYRKPIRHQQPIVEQPEKPKYERPKREHYDYDDQDSKGSSGVTGPVHTFVKTDKNANYKWGVRHHVGNKFAS